MSSTRSRRRVAVAAAAALLAGTGTAWVTHPEASATPPLTGRMAATSQAPASPSPALSPASPSPAIDPVGPGRTRQRAGSPVVPTADGPGSPAADGPEPPPPVATRTADTQKPPTTIAIDRVGVRMAILPMGVASDGQMALPPDPDDVGWYRYGPRPGDSAGSTVLAAHIDSTEYGVGPMARLRELRAGDVITVGSGGTPSRYVVSSVRQIQKKSLDLTSLFARTGAPRLHLITCGGDYDRQERHYEQNVVVLALPAP